MSFFTLGEYNLIWNNKEEGTLAKKLVTCGTQGFVGRSHSDSFSAVGAYCFASEPPWTFAGQKLLA